jgi:hypothetical protein
MPVKSIWENVNGLFVVVDVVIEDFRTVSGPSGRMGFPPPVLIPSTVTRPEVDDERMESLQLTANFYM